jgi:hypothetical protein
MIARLSEVVIWKTRDHATFVLVARTLSRVSPTWLSEGRATIMVARLSSGGAHLVARLSHIVI